MSSLLSSDASRPWTRVRNMLMTRALVCLLALGVFAFSQGTDVLAPENFGAYAVLLVAVVVNVPYLLFLRLTGRGRALGMTVVAVDVLLVTGLVVLGGPVGAYFTYFYFGPILAAATIFGFEAGMVVASISTVIVAAYGFCELLGMRILSDRPSWIAESRNFWSTTSFLVINGFFYHFVAYVSGQLFGRLRRQNILTDEVLQNIGEGVVVVDANLRVVYASPRAHELAGHMGPVSSEPTHLDDTFPPEVSDILRQCLKTLNRKQTELTFYGRGRKSRPVFLKAQALTDHRGVCRGVVAILEDLSDAKKMEEAVLVMDRLETVSQIAAAIAHEIRNPIGSIRGSAQELKHLPQLTEGDAKLLDVVVSESDRISRIVTDFLQFADLRKPRFQKVLLGDVLAEVAMLLDGRRGSADLKTEMDVASPERLYVLADREQLIQVLLNLGLNAFEAMGEAGVLEIKAAAQVPESSGEPGSRQSSIPKVEIVFRDHGPGIPSEAAAMIFKPFFTTKEKGSGMGLPTVRRIVNAHGGDIEAANHPAGGAVFTIRLSGWLGEEAEARTTEDHAPATVDGAAQAT
jgi:signal transduction histidine kinase